jgi:hypothetical protein
MFSKDLLRKSFESTGLILRFAGAPFASGPQAEGIFGLDIRRGIDGNARTEYFLCWPGDEEANTVNVAAMDKSIEQLVLSVKEAKREFIETVFPSIVKVHIEKDGEDGGLAVMLRSNSLRMTDVAEWKPKQYVLRLCRKTSDRSQHYLLGVDERQLFMAKLPKAATSVKGAMELLKAPEVRFAEGKASGRTLRQGEWFLLNPTTEEEQAIRDYLKKSTHILYKKVSVGKYAGRDMGKPHIVDELLAISGAEAKTATGWPVRGRATVFIRGALRHPDHATVKLGSWRKVILNAEDRGGGLGGTWID